MTTREKLINAIYDLAGDEYEGNASLLVLAKASEDELVDNLIHIAEFYKGEASE